MKQRLPDLTPEDLGLASWETAPKAAKICGVTKQAIYDRVKRGTCIARQFHGLTLVEIEDLKCRMLKRS